MADQRWDRWTFASISKHFDDRKQGIPLHIEGVERDTKDDKSWFELRVDGPDPDEMSKDYWRIFCEINLLVSTKFNDTNFHTHHRNVGIASAIFKKSILTYKYAMDGVTDSESDESFWVCLKLINKRDGVKVRHFGVIEQDIRMVQSTVEGHYEAKFDYKET